MKAETAKPALKGAAEVTPKNGTNLNVETSTTEKREETKAELKKVNAIERILNDLEVLNNRRENREHLLESKKKLKSFNPTVTESTVTLTIKDNKGNQFQTTHSEALKMVIGNYIAIVDRKLDEVETDISNIASKLAA